MNIKNNRRRRASRDAIENIFIELLQTKSLNEISVSDICKKSRIKPKYVLRQLYGYLSIGGYNTGNTGG